MSAFDRDLPFVHRLQEGALCAGRGPVDLVGQQHVGEDWPFAKLEITEVSQVDAGSQNVAREHIGRKLQPREAAVQALGDRLGQQSFADARRVLDEEVSLGEQRHDGQPDRIGLAQENAGDVALQSPESGCCSRASPSLPLKRSIKCRESAQQYKRA